MSPPESNCNRHIYKQHQQQFCFAKNVQLSPDLNSQPSDFESMPLLSRSFLPVELIGLDPS